MTFSITWNESYPSGTNLLSGVDTYIQEDKIAVRERLESLLGITDFETRDPMSADVFHMDGIDESFIIGGAVSWGVKDNAGAQINLTVLNDGTVTARGGLVSSSGDSSLYNLDVVSQARCVEFDAGNCTGAKTLDLDNGQNQLLTLTGATTLTLSNPLAGAWYQFRIVQGGSGSYGVTWPATFEWQADGVAPALSTIVGRNDIVAAFYTGTKFLATVAGLNWNP